MEHRSSTFRLLLPVLGLSLTWLAVAEVAAREVPEGIQWGPWVLAPFFRASYLADSNVFLEPNDDESSSDRVAEFTGGLVGHLPFRNSSLELGYATSKEDYEVAEFSSDWAQKGEIDLELNFKSGDTLSLRDVYREDFARSSSIELGDDIAFGDVRVFEPEPYTLNRWEVEFSRDEPQRQGYLVRVRRQVFVYNGETAVGFFDYRGFDNVFEYRQPMPGKRRLLLRYGTRRFKHYDPRCKSETEDQCLGGIGVPFRKELSDNLEAGLMGTLGDRQPYVVRLGYSWFRYEGTRSSESKGLVGYAAWRIVLGNRTNLELRASRQPLPATETYYISNSIRAKLKREWLHFESDAELRYYLNDYADPVSGCDLDGGVLAIGRRRDSTYKLDASWAWRMHETFKIEISAFHTNRRSSCDNADYQSTGVGTGIVLGW